MSVCAFNLCLGSPVRKQRPCDGLIPRPRSPTDQETEEAAKVQQRAAEPQIGSTSEAYVLKRKFLPYLNLYQWYCIYI
jgi:hypothetical protein